LLGFVGLGTPGLQNRQRIRDESFIFYSGLLSLLPRSAAALEQLVADYFDVPAELDQFVGAWQSLGSDDCCALDAGRPNSDQIGFGAVAGDEIWTHQSRARLKLGPLPLDKYLGFLPHGAAYPALKSLLDFFVNNEVEIEVELILQREQVPFCTLDAPAAPEPMLGWTTWMKSSPGFGRDPADAVFLIQ
jgi:type VI secretion system protein ImpH